MSRITWILFCAVATLSGKRHAAAQTFEFLRLPAHARLAALGGVNVSLADRDVSFFHSNPALTGDTLNGFAAAAYQLYVGDVGNALFSYAHGSDRLGQLIIGIQHTSYGSFQGYDPSGVETLEYDAGETAIVVGRTHRAGHFRLGASFRVILSNIAGYRATAVALDLGGVFKHPTEELSVGLVMKNLGLVLSDYRDGSSTSLPFDVQVGVTFKPEHMPLRFSFTGFDLLTSGLLPSQALSGEGRSSLSKIFAHVNAGAEILLHKNVNVLVGYNYLLHETLKADTGGGGGGFSFGFSLLVKPVEVVFSRNSYTVGNAGYSFTLLSNMNQLLRKKYSKL